jgi:hypothetical protein
MHGKSDLKLSLQMIFPSTWPPNRPDLHPALYPSALRLSKNVPQIHADKLPTVFAPIIRNLAFTRLRQPITIRLVHSSFSFIHHAPAIYRQVTLLYAVVKRSSCKP